jgi:tetratricopeptide (TPR) repeat protein
VAFWKGVTIRKKGKPEGVVLVFLGLAILFGLTDSLNKFYRGERGRRAEAHYRSGEALARAGKQAEAVEEYHAALTFAKNNGRYELALAMSLMELGRLDEAVSHLTELHDSDPNNAEIDLLLARIEAKQGRTEDAVASYHQAIYGLWPDDPKQNRLQARFEVADLLARTGQSRQMLAEVLALGDEAPDDSATLDRIGELLLRQNSAEHAAEIFARALKVNPRDPAATLGAARADFLRGNYVLAANRARRAARLDPGNAQAQQLADECAEILSLDPTLVSLSAMQRYDRSRTLVERTQAALESCLGAREPDADTQALEAAAHDFLAHKRREGDTPAGISLAGRIWAVRQQLCGRAPASDEALELVMEKVAK